MFTNENLTTPKHLNLNPKDFEKMLCRIPMETQAILSRSACEISNSFTFINSRLQLMKANNFHTETEYWEQLSLDATDISNFLHDFSIYIHSEQLNLYEADLTEIFSELVDVFTYKTAEKNVELSLLIGEPSFPCLTNYLCDSKKLQYAIGNIISWLIDVTDSSQFIHIKFPSSQDDFYQHNNGNQYMNIQFSAHIPESLPDIQESLYQPVSENKCICTNLSMSIAQRIIYAHKGVICLNSLNGLLAVNVFLPVQ